MSDVVEQQRYYTARKFLLSAAAIAIGTTLLWFGKIPPAVWGDIVLYSLMVFGAADVGQRAVDAWVKK